MWSEFLLPVEPSPQARRRFIHMAAEKLRCKECGVPYPLEARYVCERCFGPLEVVYDHSAIADVAAARRRIQAGSQDLWRYADFLPLAEGPPGRSNRLAS